VAVRHDPALRLRVLALDGHHGQAAAPHARLLVRDSAPAQGESGAARLGTHLRQELPPGILLRRTCGQIDCVRPDHGRQYNPTEVAAEVERLVAAGHPQKDVARWLNLPVGTVGQIAAQRLHRSEVAA
jgi:hypothetical protein